ncbi:imm11 family protein [Clostridium saccharobutylicum]|uniref:Immunity MXAN-0049 protein domain-containing protein n=2 Tax=Clostridium saccharobutylicum TaxID=169679 RepID=U5MMM6_CLOSA|nr:DUF1629 domain-containing protein [Clostridium saccharobutylicum]AGX41845.1 hypothetical protein CLSA_c08320 [Clostridium saccharobutylicum DSM 13864]AQR89120.1 hypothetical protein CLOSC_08160 [Clostridium saccharobutylicum]AQR99021.1 hypothetical protein CSACC_08230 [Clostridium saccharobutylicum]AQS13009.1 hypothetical protein CLOSACC_08230 [Clostridium saccharobutylicum]MBA2903871.1 hypothetical protein [Clostridium saccharobutylicum]
MDYFLLDQDERCTCIPELLNLYKSIDKRDINLSSADKIDDTIIFYIKSNPNTEFLDVLNKQLFLVSEDMKNILEKYNANIIFKMLPLIDFDNLKQEIYYLPIFEEIEALSEEAELNLDKTVIKKLVLNKEKIQGKKIFKIKESKKDLIIIRLDVAESLLRREFKGIAIKRVEVKEK